MIILLYIINEHSLVPLECAAHVAQTQAAVTKHGAFSATHWSRTRPTVKGVLLVNRYS